MSLIFSEELFDLIEEELSRASESIQLITAFCKKSQLIALDNCVSRAISDKKLMVRFQLGDLLSGSTDFDVLETAIKRGWKAYIRFDLHAKTYIFDGMRAVVGSANTTARGLGVGKNANLEISTLVSLERGDRERVSRLYCDALLVDDELLDKMKAEYDAAQFGTDTRQVSWSLAVTNRFKSRINVLFPYDFPIVPDSRTGMEAIREELRWSNSYMWLIQQLEDNNGCLYFGELSSLLHDDLVCTPAPRRREVKILLSDLVYLADELDMEEIVVDRPQHSQRIRLR